MSRFSAVVLPLALLLGCGSSGTGQAVDLADTGEVTLSSDGYLLVGAGKTVYRLKKAGLSLLDSPWPTVDHDFPRTRNGAR
jgi:hypothetical protein